MSQRLADRFLSVVEDTIYWAIAVMLIQQFSGINAVIFFSGEILGDAGVANQDLGGAIVMGTQVCAHDYDYDYDDDYYYDDHQYDH